MIKSNCPHRRSSFLFKRRKQKKIRNGRKIRFRECKVKDDTTIIKLIMFGDLIDEVKQKSSYKI